MPLYEYECPVHGRFLSEWQADVRLCQVQYDCDCLVPYLDGDRQHSSDCSVFRFCHRESKRKWSFQLAPVMQEHLNATTGKPVSSKRQFRDQLKQASDEATRRSLEGSLEFARAADEQGIDIGDFKPREIPHNFVPVEDREQLGVTEEGMDATKKEQTDSGNRERKFYS